MAEQLGEIEELEEKSQQNVVSDPRDHPVLHYITWLIGDGFRVPCLSSGDVWGLLLSCNEFDKLFKAELL